MCIRDSLCPGCDLDTSRQSIQLAEAYPHVYAAAGVHPEDALGLPVDWLDQVAEKMCIRDRCGRPGQGAGPGRGRLSGQTL